MQPNDLFSIPVFIDQIHTYATLWMPTFLLWMAFFLGIALVFIVAAGIIHLIMNWLGSSVDHEDDDFTSEQLKDIKDFLRENK